MRFATSGSSSASDSADLRFLVVFFSTSSVIGVFHQIGPTMIPSPEQHEMHPVFTFGVKRCCGALDAIGTRQMLAVPKFVADF